MSSPANARIPSSTTKILYKKYLAPSSGPLEYLTLDVYGTLTETSDWALPNLEAGHLELVFSTNFDRAAVKEQNRIIGIFALNFIFLDLSQLINFF